MNENYEDSITYYIDEKLNDTRIDKAIALLNDSLSRTHIQNLIDEGDILLNNKTTKASTKVKTGDEITLLLVEAKDSIILPEDIPLDIVYEDNDLLVVNKPAGMVVHPAVGNYHGTLVNALLYHCKDLSVINGVARPGIVHRIDKETSGLIVVAKNDLAHESLALQLKDKTCYRQYIALVKGVLPHSEGTIDAPIGRHPVKRKEMAINSNGKNAVTHFKVIERFADYTLISCLLETGRTHQIRVHLTYIGYPIVGDLVYGTNNKQLYDKGQLLHASMLSFIHPRTKQVVKFEAPLPDYFNQVLERLRGTVWKTK